MISSSKPRWQQVTALVSLSATGTITGFSFVPSAPADLTSPTSLPIRLLALERSAQTPPADDATLRSAIVNVASYYLQMARGKTPAEMEAIIWQHDSIDGVDHGASCAAFASLTLELAAHVVGQQSWVTGGTSYPWPLHKWADVRVDQNPASPDIISVLQDAQAHDRWHPLGDGYDPQPGDWVLFDGHVEVVTKYAGGVLYTVGGDSLPNFSVNAHEYRDPLPARGVAGFVNNGELSPAGTETHARGFHHGRGKPSSALPAIPGTFAAGAAPTIAAQYNGGAAVPGLPSLTPDPGGSGARPRRHRERGHLHAAHGTSPPRSSPQNTPTKSAATRTRPEAKSAPTRTTPARATPARATERSAPAAATGKAEADVPGTGRYAPAVAPQPGTAGAAIPGLPGNARTAAAAASPAAPYRRRQPTPGTAAVQETSAQQEFINEIAPGAIATQRKYGVPAAVTIAQAIDESGWGQSELASRDHNLFGIKGTGSAGSDMQPTEEYENGKWVSVFAPFRVYHDFAESINDHGELLATSGYYTRAMASRDDPDSFANALTGVYATNPGYGQDLIGLMRQYDLYRYDAATPAITPTAPPGAATTPEQHEAGPTPGVSSPPTERAPSTSAAPKPAPEPEAARTGTEPSARTRGPAPRPRPKPTSARTKRPGRTARPSAATPTAPATTAGPVTQSYSDQHLSAAMPSSNTAQSSNTAAAWRAPHPASSAVRRIAPRNARQGRTLYQPNLPPAVKNAFVAAAKSPLMRQELVYRDVASHSGIPWELLAACDWMQCQARPRYSPVHGERLGAVNSDGTVYRTKSEALEQCAYDLVELAEKIYDIDLNARLGLSLTDLANVFAAFRWGGLLKLHHTSAMEFPYSVAGLTAQHLSMRWPNIDEPNTPDKPGGRFRKPFGAVPVVLSLSYPATA